MAGVSAAGAMLGVIAFAQSGLTLLLDRLGVLDPALEKVIERGTETHSVDRLSEFFHDAGSGAARRQAMTGIVKHAATVAAQLVALLVSLAGLAALVYPAVYYRHGPVWVVLLVAAAILAFSLLLKLLVLSLTGNVQEFSRKRPPPPAGGRRRRAGALLDLHTPAPYFLFLLAAAGLSAAAGIYFA